MTDHPEVSIVMPCLNEAETLASCITKARQGLQAAGVRGEIIVADNGSTDGSPAIAEKLGVRVIRVAAKGYGNALRGGIDAAVAAWIVMGDADDSYDFSRLEGFIQKLREGFDLVMGCRLPGGGGVIAPGAMSWKNRAIGNPVLSFVGRRFFKCPVHDFHCGLRALTKTAWRRLELRTTGMEFASEMVVKAALKSLRIAEVPITLHRAGRSRRPHLRPWRDGWRHLRFMLIFSPRWLFLAPGLVLTAAGALVAVPLSLAAVPSGRVMFDVGTLLVACMAVIIGLQLVTFALFTKVFAIAEGLLPQDAKFARLFKCFTLEKGIAAGIVVWLAGTFLLLRAWVIWQQAGFGTLPYADNLRRLIPAVTLLVLGIQVIFSSFFMSVLGLNTTARTPPALAEHDR